MDNTREAMHQCDAIGGFAKDPLKDPKAHDRLVDRSCHFSDAWRRTSKNVPKRQLNQSGKAAGAEALRLGFALARLSRRR